MLGGNNIVTLDQLKGTYSVANDIIDNLDDYALQELMSGDHKDIDELFDVMIEETHKALYAPEIGISDARFDYLSNFTDTFESTLRKASLPYFCLTVLPDFELAPHIMDWFNMVQMYQYLCVIASRGHAKSHSFSYALPLWKMYRYSDTFLGKKDKEYQMSREGLLVTNEIGLARSLLDKVKTEIEGNDILREILYPGTREGWGTEGIKCKNDAKFFVKSYGSKMRGFHPTYIIVDDFLNESTLYSAEQKTKYNTFFHSVIMNMVMKDGQVAVVGTPFVAGDLYDDLKNREDWWVFEYPALFPDGTILWETMHTFDSLMKLKDTIGSVNFSREILVRPITSESSVFSIDGIRQSYSGMDNYSLVNNIHNHPLKNIFSKIICGTDFALSSSSSADYTAYYVIGVDNADRYWLLHVFRGKGLPYDQQVSEAKRINRDFHPDIFVVETNGAQRIFSDMMKEAGLPVLDHHTGVEKHSFEEGIPAMSILFEQGRIKLPRGDQRSKDITDLLTSQYMSFTYDADKGKLVFVMDHDDDAMAFWQAIRGAKYSGGGLKMTFL